MADRIEKEIVLKAPRSRVWKAISDKTEFSTWFRVAFPPGTFTAGETVRGRITYPGYENMMMDIHVVEVTPETRLSYRWHPGDDDAPSDPMTLVTFTLEDVDGGTRLKVVESGFEGIPAERREKAFRLNDGGWTEQMTNIERHVAAK